jgi:hypothetical protein
MEEKMVHPGGWQGEVPQLLGSIVCAGVDGNRLHVRKDSAMGIVQNWYRWDLVIPPYRMQRDFGKQNPPCDRHPALAHQGGSLERFFIILS